MIESGGKGTAKRTVILVFALLLIVAMAVGVYVVWKRGKAREGVWERALSALQHRQDEEAERLLREVLRSDPRHRAARDNLVQLLIYQNRAAEARAVCKEWQEILPEDDAPTRYFCQIALSEGNFADVERIARTLVDRAPEFAHSMISQVQDWRGVSGTRRSDRLAASETALYLASVTKEEDVAARALLQAGSIQMELAAFEPRIRTWLEDSARRHLAQAAERAGSARMRGKVPDYDAIIGRIRVLSAEEQEAATGAASLRQLLEVEKKDEILYALANYHMRRQEFQEAIDLVRAIRHPYFFQRALWWLQQAGQREAALQLLEGPAADDTPGRILQRADLLLQGDDSQKAAGRAALVGLIRTTGTPKEVVWRAVALLATRLDANAALEVVDGSPDLDRKDPRFAALLAALMSAQGVDRVKVAALIEQVAQELDQMGQSLGAMQLLGTAGGEVLDQYLEAQVEKGGETGLSHRLLRAFQLLRQAQGEKDTAASAALRERAITDLRALLSAKETAKTALVNASNLALALGETALAGSLLGRAIPMDGEPEMLDGRALELAAALKEGDHAARLAQGLRESSRGSPAQAFLEVLADAVERRGEEPARLLDALDAAAAQEGSRVLALRLQGNIAFRLEQMDRAEACGRNILSKDPKDVDALVLLGAIRMRLGNYQEVLTLHGEHDSYAILQWLQIVGANMQLDRKDIALKMAKRALAEYPDNAIAHLLLADVYIRRDQKREALSILSIAPPTPLGLSWRARLLLDLKQYDLAEQAYESMLTATAMQDLAAWNGLTETMLAAKRQTELIEILGKALRTEQLKENKALRAHLHTVRGTALEGIGRVAEALADYEAAIALDPDDWRALNNAAWQIAMTTPSRIGEARAMIDRALQQESMRPQDRASLLDTAAKVLSVQGDKAGALQRIEEALAAAPEARYRLRRAQYLLDLGKEKEAREALDAMFKEDPRGDMGKQARSILNDLDRKEEERKAAEQGGGAGG